MDFGTIKKRLNTFSYKNGQEFLNDMKLVFDNCILYNGVSGILYNLINIRLILKLEWLLDPLKRNSTISSRFLILIIISNDARANLFYK